jgi:Flp pilus assembly protein TadD
MPDRARRPLARQWIPAVAIGIGAALAVAAWLAGSRRGAAPGRAAPDPATLEAEAAAHPEDPDRLLIIGERLRRAGQGARAFEIIARAYDRRFTDPRFTAAMVEALLETGRLQEAQALAAGELPHARSSGDLHAALAEVMLKAGRYDSALDLARRAVRLAPASPRANRALAHAAAVEKILPEAWPAFERGVALAPDDGGLLADYGEALSRYGRSEQAGRVLQRAAQLRPGDPRVLGLLGAHLGQRAQTPAELQRAVALLRRAAALAPGGTEPRYQLGKLLLLSGDPGGAAAALEECLRIDSSFEEVWFPLGQAYQTLGRESEARRAFAAYQNYADFRREAAQLELRLRRAPHRVDLLLRMARLQESHGRREWAARYFRQALRLRPDPYLAAHLQRLERSRPARP